jgi:hypothetical protein
MKNCAAQRQHWANCYATISSLSCPPVSRFVKKTSGFDFVTSLYACPKHIPKKGPLSFARDDKRDDGASIEVVAGNMLLNEVSPERLTVSLNQQTMLTKAPSSPLSSRAKPRDLRFSGPFLGMCLGRPYRDVTKSNPLPSDRRTGEFAGRCNVYSVAITILMFDRRR